MAIIVGAKLHQNQFLDAIEAGAAALGGGLGLAALLLIFICMSILLMWKKNKILASFVRVIFNKDIQYGFFMGLGFVIFILFAAGLLYGKSK